MYKTTLKKFILATPILACALLFTLIASDAFAFTTDAGKTIRVKWSSFGITPGTCSSSGGHAAWPSGSRSDVGQEDYLPGTVPPGTYSNSFSCVSDPTSNAGGATITAVGNLTVLPAGAVSVVLFSRGSTYPIASSTPTLTISSSASYISVEDTFSLSWNYSDPYGTCVASGSWSGTKSPVSSISLYNNNVSLLGRNRTYGISCSSGGATIYRSIVVRLEGRNACPTC